MTKKIATILVLAVCMTLSACNFGERKIDTATNDTAEKIYISPTQFPSYGTSGQVSTSLEVCGQEGIILLAASYYSALSEGDTSALLNLVSNPERISDDVLKDFSDVKKIDVKRVYTLDGIGTVDTVAYVYYEIIFEGFETPVPSLDELFIANTNGTYSILNGTIPLDEYNALLELTSSEGVRQLTDSVNRAFLEALDSDTALKDHIGF